MPLSLELAPRIAGYELNALRLAGVLGDALERLRVARRGTPIHDIDGSVLYLRLPLLRGRVGAGWADVATHEVFAEPLIAVSHGAAWDEKALVAEGSTHARRIRRGLRFDTVRFVAYSHPKIALQFLAQGEEVLMLELFTWLPVPPREAKPRSTDEAGPEVANFQRWSVVEHTPARQRRARAASLRKRLAFWDAPALRRIDPTLISADTLAASKLRIRLFDTRELHYSANDTDHAPCYELRGQQTNVWCVAASAEMLLNFYRYGYSQVRLATELGLGTLANPNGLPYARDGDVVTVIERLSSNALDATMTYNPSWTLFRDEIRANRPLISFVPGHSRTVAGYTRSLIHLIGSIGFRGLLVYDPWPPSTGVITRWENFATQTYRVAFTAVLRHV
jgi:hypothetical protein